MSLNVSLHRPTWASAHEFTSDGERHGSVAFADADGERVTLFTTPHVARALADASNAAVAVRVERDEDGVVWEAAE